MPTRKTTKTTKTKKVIKKANIHKEAEDQINAKLKSGELEVPKFNKILGQDKVKKALEVAAKTNIPALLIGETGTGKTSLVRELAMKHNKRFSRFNMTGETSVDEFLGKYTLLNQNTVWQDGILVQAMKEGHWLVVDEINMALPEVITLLHSLLDDDRFITLVNHDGEIVRCHEDFRFFATMNPTDEYAGTKELNKAFFSRFGIVEEVKYPPKATEVNILRQVGTSEEVARHIVDVALTIRSDKTAGRVYYTCSTRDLLHWAALVETMGLQRSFELAILNKSINDKEQLVKCYEAVNSEYQEYETVVQRLHIKDALQAIDEMDQRDAQLKDQARMIAEKEQHTEQLRNELEQELNRVRAQEERTREEIRAEIIASIKARFDTAFNYAATDQ